MFSFGCKNILSFFDSSISNYVPYVKDAYLILFEKKKVAHSHQLSSLSVLGMHICLVSGLSALWIGKKTLIITSIALMALFRQNYETSKLIEDLENILSQIQTNNKKLKKILRTMQDSSEAQIELLKEASADYKAKNEQLNLEILNLKEDIKALESLIKTTQLTVENLDRLKLEEKETLSRLTEIKEKLEHVRHLFEEERRALRKEVEKLSSEIVRLGQVA